MNPPYTYDIPDEPESWRGVVGHPDFEVSTLGRVRSLERIRPHGRSGATQRFKGKVLKPHVADHGYIRHTLDAKQLSVHRMMLEAFVGPPPYERSEGAHWDGSRDNNRLSNLRWATVSENQMDRVRHGTDVRGDRHGSAKMTWEAVREIRAMASRPTCAELGERYGVKAMCIHKIINFRSWREDNSPPPSTARWSRRKSVS